MRNRKIHLLAGLMAALVFALSACGQVDESFLETEANYGVNISVPYATATPLPEYLNVPDAIVIDQDGNVTLNDASIIEGDFQSTRNQEEQTEYRSLSLGATGIAVQALQARLEELGYYAGEISGVFDAGTEAAVRRFEQTFGTMQTGVATSKLQLRLFSASAPVFASPAYNEAVVAQYAVLRPGAVGSSVYALQQRLKNLGYPINDLTGAYDDQTGLCVRLFYQMYGVAATNVADVNMQRQLYAEDALRYDPSVISVEAAAQAQAETGDGEAAGPAIEAGATGSDVRQVQQRLIALGYMAQGGASGTFDDATVAAVNRFLQAVGTEPTGTLSQEMQDFLMSDEAPRLGEGGNDTEYQNLNPGDRGEAVLALQRRLVELGYASGNPNGQYGNATISAVQLYQSSNGMDVDGLASAWMQAMLFSPNALTYDQAMGIEAANTPGPVATPEPTPAGEQLYFTLALGSTGNAVAELQNRLIELGYTLSDTQVFDEATQQAVIDFQNAICVAPTGEASGAFQRYIRSKAAPGPGIRFYALTQNFTELHPGDTGDEVDRLQQQLIKLNLLRRRDIQGSTGSYNEATRQAVIKAQEAMGYDSADGVAGVEFQSFLFSRYSGKIRQRR